MTWFLTHIETIWKAFAGFVLLILGFVWRKNLIEKGYDTKEKEIADANMEAIKKGKQTKEAISKLTDSELDKRMRDSL